MSLYASHLWVSRVKIYLHFYKQLLIMLLNLIPSYGLFVLNYLDDIDEEIEHVQNALDKIIASYQ